MDKVEDQRLQKRRLALFPEWVVVLHAFGRGIADEVGHKAQHVVVGRYVLQGVIAERTAHVDQVEHFYIIAEAFHQVAGVAAYLPLGVGNDEGCIALQHVGLGVKAGLARAGAADNQHVEVAPVGAPIQTETDVFCKDQVFRGPGGGIAPVDGTGLAPARRAIFF